ncbi:MAG: hypothetical protein ACREL2_01340, partial [Gemmatimonadales bacterium]
MSRRWSAWLARRPGRLHTIARLNATRARLTRSLPTRPSMVSLHWIDYAVMATYFVFVLGIGAALKG